MSCVYVQYCNDVMVEDLLNMTMCKRPCDWCALFRSNLILRKLQSHLSDKTIESSRLFMKESQNDWRGCFFLFLTVTHLEAHMPHHNTC